MSEFRFISDLDIEALDCLSVEETKECLKNKETKAKEEIYKLTGKLTLLRQQLEDIQKKLIKLETPHTDIVLGQPTITKDASAYEKACFLLDLFHGRRDVYAIRRWNRDKEKSSTFLIALMHGLSYVY